MVRVTITTNTGRSTDIYNENKTIKEILNDAGIDYGSGSTTLDGCYLGVGELDKTLAEHGIVSECRISCVTKTNNA